MNLISLENKCEKEIVYMTNMLHDQRKKLMKFRPVINIDDISINLKLNDGNFELLPELLKSTTDFSLQNLHKENSKVDFMAILERDKHWKCFKCQKDYNLDVAFCSDCTCFRPLEMFKNILYSPTHLISDFEIEFMQKRREMEKTMIGENFSSDERRSCDDSWAEDLQTDKYFFISTEWLQQWKQWVQNKDPKSSILGTLPPGPICNNQLFIGFSS